jgi:LysM repeat protein
MIRILFLLLTVLASAPAYCQDLLAKQAPVASKSQTLTLNIDPKGIISIQKKQATGNIPYTLPKNSPVDEKMKQVDSIVLKRRLDKEDIYNKNDDPYEDQAEDVHYHKVKQGETLPSIARKCHITVEKLCELNHINKNAKLKPGQILKYN